MLHETIVRAEIIEGNEMNDTLLIEYYNGDTIDKCTCVAYQNMPIEFSCFFWTYNVSFKSSWPADYEKNG